MTRFAPSPAPKLKCFLRTFSRSACQSYAATLGTTFSTSRRNRELRAPATNDNCESSAGPAAEVFAFWDIARRDRLLRPPATKIQIQIKRLEPDLISRVFAFANHINATSTPDHKNRISPAMRWKHCRAAQLLLAEKMCRFIIFDDLLWFAAAAMDGFQANSDASGAQFQSRHFSVSRFTG